MTGPTSHEFTIQFTSDNTQDAAWLMEGKDALDVVGSELREDGLDVNVHESAGGASDGVGERAIGPDTVVVGIAINLVSDVLFRLISEVVGRLRQEAVIRRVASQVEFRSGNVSLSVSPDISADNLKDNIEVLAQAVSSSASLQINRTTP